LSEIARLAEPIRNALLALARELELDARNLTTEPILNWGGFVNRSFRVSDGHRVLFLKLSSDPAIKRGLETWRDLATLLELRYHAPHMTGWLEVQGTGFSGPLFEWIDGSLAADRDADLMHDISRLIANLHGDEDIASRLPGPIRTCAAAYFECYHARFNEDLEFVAASPPPFVDHDRISWLQREIVALAARVEESAAFSAPADRPVHGDLWLNNVLIDRTGRWYLLDWDGLALSDPVIDWTMLFGPTREDPCAASPDLVLSHVPMSGDEQSRLDVYLQASQLDWVLDPLADWVQSAREPEHGAVVRRANEKVYWKALATYQSRFGR
jgi:fructosamine-3-kinase